MDITDEVGIFFEYNDEVIQIPVNPEKIEFSMQGEGKSVYVLKLGEVNMINYRKLTSISFESFFPAESWFPAIRTAGKFKSCDYYKEFFARVLKQRKPMRMVVTGIDVSSAWLSGKLVSIEKFEFDHQAGDHEDCYYSLELKEYRDYAAKEVTKVTSSTSSSSTSTKKGTDTKGNKSTTATKITIGATVIVNGTLYRDSYGNGAGVTEKNATRKVNYIVNGRKCPYHVTTLSGGWRGWVTADSVKLK
jgi:hypothetical protein